MQHAENWLDHDLRFDVHRRVRGEGQSPEEITYGYGEAWFGAFLAAFTGHGLCWFEPFPAAEPEQRISKFWTRTRFTENSSEVETRIEKMLAAPGQSQKLHLCGTPYQLRVWEALLCVPRGGVVSYGDLAKMMGNHRAARALGNAVGANNLALLVPCHRVKPVSGLIGNYRWGVGLKQELLDREARYASVAA